MRLSRWVGVGVVIALAAGVLPAAALTISLPEEATARLTGAERGARTGTAVAAAGDFDGDGVDDLVTGGRNVAYLALGGAAGELDTDDPRVVRLGITKPERRQDLSVAAAGDVDADGFGDVLVGAPRVNDKAGAAFLVYGRPDPADLVVDDPAAARVVRIDGAQAGDRAGTSVASAGDADGDGGLDVIVGARAAGARDRGAAYVLSGAALETHQDLASLGTAGYRIHSPAFGKDVGYSVAAAGDVDGDGLGDVVVGAPADLVTARPAAYVVFGRAGHDDVMLRDLGGGGWAIRGSREEDHEGAGEAVSGGHDVNGDGVPDVVVGAPSATGRFGHNGAAFVVFGKGDAEPVDLDDLGPRGYRIESGPDGFAAGSSVALVPDHDGNGLADVLVGDPFERHGRRDATVGAAYHLIGQTGPGVVDLGRLGRDGVRYLGSGDDRTGTSVAAVGDFDGDGGRELATGAPGLFGTVRNGGAVYLFAPAEPAPYDRPPGAMLLSYAARQRAMFGSYCWDGVCVDRRPTFPRAENAGTGDHAHFRILYRERPDDVSLTAFRKLDEFGRPTGEGRAISGQIEPVREFQGAPVAAWEVRFRLPKRPGALYLVGSAVWDGLDRGDVSWFLHLRLRRAESNAGPSGPPRAMLHSDGVRERGALFSYCWSDSFSDGTGVTMCADYIRIEPLPPRRARAGARAFIRIHSTYRPDKIRLRIYREVSSGYPSGDARRPDYRLRRHVENGRTQAWDVRFRLPERRGHVYPAMYVTWAGHGTAPYDWHLLLR